MIRHKEVKKTAEEYLVESLRAYNMQEDIENRKDYIDVRTGGSLDTLYEAYEMLRELILKLEDTGTVLQEDNKYTAQSTVKIMQMLQDIQNRLDKTPVEKIV